MIITRDLDFTKEHRKHAMDRWQVWCKGYGLLFDVAGKLYVYGVRT